ADLGNLLVDSGGLRGGRAGRIHRALQERRGRRGSGESAGGCHRSRPLSHSCWWAAGWPPTVLRPGNRRGSRSSFRFIDRFHTRAPRDDCGTSTATTTMTPDKGLVAIDRRAFLRSAMAYSGLLAGGGFLAGCASTGAAGGRGGSIDLISGRTIGIQLYTVRDLLQAD